MIEINAKIEIHHHQHNDDDAIMQALGTINDQLGEIAADQATANEGIAKLLAEHQQKPVGIEIVPGPPQPTH